MLFIRNSLQIQQPRLVESKNIETSNLKKEVILIWVKEDLSTKKC